MNIQHQLFPRDYQRRVDFCNWFRARPARFHDRDHLIGDEAAFKMDGKANTWNIRSYTPKNQPPANFNFKRNCNPGKVTFGQLSSEVVKLSDHSLCLTNL
jgi:hypothetical protein